MTLWVSSPYYNSSSCQVWWSQALRKEKNPFFICHVTARDFWVRESCDIGILKNHRHFRREDNKLSIFHVTSRDRMVRGSCKHHGRVLLIVSHHLLKFSGHRLCGIGDNKLLICRMTQRHHVVRGSCDIMGNFPSS